MATKDDATTKDPASGLASVCRQLSPGQHCDAEVVEEAQDQGDQHRIEDLCPTGADVQRRGWQKKTSLDRELEWFRP